eukprot:comp22408_c0_seq3/m.33511 comp22408_c0_seq3/g.33511  ORF comp22408_c0_seq3/g.33511 comp22408_c0_seq3/m.33511 type:complete len:295 (-) comp22408_c0_seq3:746-1630(-)
MYKSMDDVNFLSTNPSGVQGSVSATQLTTNPVCSHHRNSVSRATQTSPPVLSRRQFAVSISPETHETTNTQIQQNATQLNTEEARPLTTQTNLIQTPMPKIGPVVTLPADLPTTQPDSNQTHQPTTQQHITAIEAHQPTTQTQTHQPTLHPTITETHTHPLAPQPTTIDSSSQPQQQQQPDLPDPVPTNLKEPCFSVSASPSSVRVSDDGLAQHEVIWMRDQDCMACLKCSKTFGVFVRRHHCRKCGGIFCGACSSSKMPLPQLGYTDKVRVCDPCYAHGVLWRGVLPVTLIAP